MSLEGTVMLRIGVSNVIVPLASSMSQLCCEKNWAPDGT
jgi:hypothetical protein